MSKKYKIVTIISVLCAVLINFYIFFAVRPNPANASSTLTITLTVNQAIKLQVFYADSVEFLEEQSLIHEYTKPNEPEIITVEVDGTAQFLRMDFGELACDVEITEMSVQTEERVVVIDVARMLTPYSLNDITNIESKDDGILIHAEDGDPYFVVAIGDLDFAGNYTESLAGRYFAYRVLLCLVVDMIILVCIRSLKTLTAVPRFIYRDRAMFWDLTRNDFRARFAGSYFGVFWAFVQPVIQILLYWFVFQVGLRSGNVSNHPFILYLMAGLIPWFYFQEAINGGTNVLVEYSYLVKKVVFEVGVLPVLKVASAIFVHIFFVVFIILICLIYGYMPDPYLLQLLYYIVCMSFLVLGLVYITSACTAFFRDMAQIVNIMLTIGVWLTPIMWNASMVESSALQFVLRLNPMYYIVDGYRDALLNKLWFWDKPVWTVYFWVVSILIYICGVKMFNRLKPHFSDVL